MDDHDQLASWIIEYWKGEMNNQADHYETVGRFATLVRDYFSAREIKRILLAPDKYRSDIKEKLDDLFLSNPDTWHVNGRSTGDNNKIVVIGRDLNLGNGASDVSVLDIFFSQTPSDKKQAHKQSHQSTPSSNSVFISYSNKDRDIANVLKNELCMNNIHVIIDWVHIQPGESIEEFVDKAIRKSDHTLAIVSKDSLLSAWVAMETIKSLECKTHGMPRKLIPCIVDKEFFNSDFTDKAIDWLDDKINTIDKCITGRKSKNRNVRDLESERKRYHELKENLDEIVRKLKESHCADISGDNLKSNLPKILQAING